MSDFHEIDAGHFWWYTAIIYWYVIDRFYHYHNLFMVYKLWDLPESIENWSIFWWRHIRSRWRHRTPVFNGSRDLGLIFQQKNFWLDWSNQLLAEFMTRHPTFQISTTVKTYILRKKSSTKPLFPLSRQRWIRW